MNVQRLPRVLVVIFFALVATAAARSSLAESIKVNSYSVAPLLYEVNGKPMTLTFLGRWLVMQREQFGHNLPTFIHPANTTTAATLESLFNTLRRAGVHQPFLYVDSDSDAPNKYWVCELGPPRRPAGVFSLRPATKKDLHRDE